MLRSDARDSKGTENDPLVQKAREWKAKEAKLRQLFEEKPEQRIPEMRWLVDDQWQSIARDADLDTTRGIRVALGRVREVAMIQFSLKIKQALFTYMNANDKRLPDDPSQLAPYFRPPVDDAEAILSRYEMLSKERQSEAPFKGASIIQKVLIDKAVDNALIVGLSTMGFVPKQGHAPVNLPRELGPVLKAYMDANNHTSPLDNDDLKPYATTPEQKAALEKFIRDLSQ